MTDHIDVPPGMHVVVWDLPASTFKAGAPDCLGMRSFVSAHCSRRIAEHVARRMNESHARSGSQGTFTVLPTNPQEQLP